MGTQLGSQPPPPPDLTCHCWRPACGGAITRPLITSKALTLIFHNQDGLTVVFFP